MDDFFRSLFGFGSRNRSEGPRHDDFIDPRSGFWGPSPPPGFDQQQPPREWDPQQPPPGQDQQQPLFSFHENADMFRHFDEMFHGFEEMFRQMGIADFPAPRGLPPGSLEEPAQENRSPRDYMLKEPDSQPPERDRLPFSQPFFGGIWSQPRQPEQNDKVDKDLDNEVNLADILAPPPPPQQSPITPPQSPATPPQHSFRQSVSVRTYRNINGQVEEERIVKDGSGSEERTVTRTVDGQTHSVTTQTDATGKREVTENMLNMDEDDKAKFDNKFSAPNSDQTLTVLQPSGDYQGLFQNIFRNWFPGPKS